MNNLMRWKNINNKRNKYFKLENKLRKLVIQRNNGLFREFGRVQVYSRKGHTRCEIFYRLYI